MTDQTRLKALQSALARYEAGKLSRRQFVNRLGALGLGAAALTLLGRGGRRAAAQEGTPPAAGTPVVGINPDGTRTWKVLAGGMWMGGAMGEVSAFLPGTITINAGDTIYWEFMGFHNVAFSSGDAAPPLIIPADPSVPPVATPPSAGASQPQFVINPAVAFPSGGPTYDGTGFVNSGVPIDPAAPPFTVTFTTPGDYDYACLIHQPFMVGKVIVQEAGSPLPMEQDGVDAKAQEELAAFVATAESLFAAAATPSAAGGTEVAIGPSQENVELLTFLPQEVRIAAGETVRWTYAGSMSPHTVTFLGGEPALEDLIIVPGEAGPPTLAINPNSFFPSDSVGQPYSGQGLVHSGYMGPFPGMPTTFELTFATAGEYRYYCVLHAGGPEDPPTEAMVGTVIVE